MPERAGVKRITLLHGFAVRQLLVLLLMGVALPLWAQTAVVVDLPVGFGPDSAPLATLPFLFLKDKQTRYHSPEQLLADRDLSDEEGWRSTVDGHMPETYSDDYYWLVTRIHNDTGGFTNAVFDLNFPREPFIELYVLRADGALNRYETGSWREYNDRAIDYRNFAFPLEMVPDETLTLFFHVKNRPRHVIESSRVMHPIAFMESVNDSSITHLLCIGALVTVAIYNLLLMVFTREKTFGFFLLFLLATLFGLLVYLGYASRVLWPDSDTLPQLEIPLSPVVFSITLLLFVIDFCDMGRQAPRLRNGLVILTLLSFVPLIVARLATDSAIYIELTLGTLMLPILAMAGACVWLSLRGNESARALLVAWAVALAGMAIWGVQKALDPANNFFAIEVGQLSLVGVLSFLVVKRITRLRDTEQRALAESRAKSEFLAQMSHEIRNPMNGVLGMTQLLQETALDETQRQYTNTINSSASALLVILNDILDVSKLDAGKFRLERIAFDIRNLVEDSACIFSLQAQEKAIDLSFSVDDDVPPYVYGDPNRIRQVIVNFLSNAFKFTKQGAISLSVSRASTEPLALKISVKDTGIGIPLDRQHRLFERFEQLNESVARKYGGTGLGLAICKMLSQLMGGDVGVKSMPEKGSTFWFTFTAEEASEEELLRFEGFEGLEGDAESLNILVAEDGDVNRVIVKHFIEKLGHHCQLAENGEQALSLLKDNLEQAGHIDMVFMDGDMPVMDGLEATRRWREIEQQHQLDPLPIIALTAHLLPDYIERCEQSGMNAHLSKPIQLLQLHKMIRRFKTRPARRTA